MLTDLPSRWVLTRIRLPGLSTVDAAAETDIDVFLQVATLGPAQIIHTQQRSLGRHRQRRDSRGVHAIVIPLAERETDPFAHARRGIARFDLADRCVDLRTVGIDLVRKFGCLSKSTRKPK